MNLRTMDSGLEKLLSVPEADADGAGSADEFAVRVNGFQAADGVGNVHRFDFGSSQADHFPKAPLRDQVHRRYPEAGAEDAVEGRRRAAALDVSQHADSHFLARTRGDG